MKDSYCKKSRRGVICNHSIFRHDNFIGCSSADKIVVAENRMITKGVISEIEADSIRPDIPSYGRRPE